MLAPVVRFSDDAAGIEKTLRLLQGLCTTLIGLAASAHDAQPWLQARYQLALGRRYFRILKWHARWESMWTAYNSDIPSSRRFLQVLKSFFLGSYFFLEMLTTTNAMRVTNYDWAMTLQDEANKCWFYSIALSILLLFNELFAMNKEPPPAKPASKKKDHLSESKEEAAISTQDGNSGARTRIYSQMLIDGCDLVIAGSNVGWIPAGQVLVGVAYVISSFIAGRQIWERVQHSP